jgi:uncharacterized protein
MNKPETSSKNLLIIFTRNPELGKVKSRLAKDVGDEAALEIYKFLLEHTVAVTKNLKATKEVYYSEEIRETDIWDSSIYHKKQQTGEDLGERMQQAFDQGFENGFKNIIIIGSDLYDLCTEDLRVAFKKLKDHEYVIGPADDGGYYLLGMKKTNPKLFKEKNWGTSSVLKDTMRDLENSSTAILEPRNDVDYYTDIKDNEDFQQFFQHLKA